MNKELMTIADNVINTLKANGFSILRYDSHTTNSIYLKLDYGVCNSIRISDHKGKSYLKYRYNVILNGSTQLLEDKYPRYYYNQNSIKGMINRIISDRDQKVNKYGQVNYDRFMRENNQQSMDKKGFWAQAKLV